MWRRWADAWPRMPPLASGGRAAYALKVAVAAGGAWLVVLPFGGVADTYPYYAPLGAVVAFADTVAGSARKVLSTVAAIALGAGLAVIGQAAPVPQDLSLVAVVLAGSWLAYGGWLGPMASWVCTSALFVLIIGGEHPSTFLGAYIGLVTVGALLALGVDAVWPALPLRTTRRALESLRSALASQLDDLADGLCEEPLPTAEQWRGRRRAIDARAGEMYRVVGEVREAGHGNWRARSAGPAGLLVQRLVRQADALAQLSFLVREAFDLISEAERDDRDDVALGVALRPSVVEALRTTAVVLAGSSGQAPAPESWERARSATEDTARCIHGLQAGGKHEYFVAAALATTLRRVLDTMAP